MPTSSLPVPLKLTAPVRLTILVVCLLLVAMPTLAADYATTLQLYQTGEYAEAEKIAEQEITKGIWNERWPRLLIQCQMAQGKYSKALEAFDAAVNRYPTSLTLRLMGVDAIRQNNDLDRAGMEYAKILQLLQSSPSRYASRDNLIAAGRYFSTRGEDARQILDLFYDRVRNADPNFIEAYIATAELALEKGDFKVAADTLQAAERIDATNPQTAYLLARAFESSDRDETSDALDRAIKLNPNHLPSLLMLADSAIDREQYDQADQLIDQVLKINPNAQEAFALRAVIAHLRGEYEEEKKLREQALKTWSKNPEVDHLIGRKLSGKYRFSEGADYQRQALVFDPNYTRASFQLAQDLLRLGEEDTGWQLAREVADEDEYNVVAHNLITLFDSINAFSTIGSDEIHVRMDPREAMIYGDDVVALLSEARRTLCEKYDIQPSGPIIVEIFPKQNDFAIRTFGLPGGAGYLGVCFGRVITANSPASQGERPANWQSVLWHEFCHVVTLEKTKNRMPRWLSEGISVYEERQRDASWGESMTPQYRQMLLADDLTPVSNLSAAFLNPKSPSHLMFAYYQSSLLIEFLIERHGIDGLKKVLVDLGDGIPINDCLSRNVGSIDRLDVEFAEYAHAIANKFAPQAEWSKDDMPEKPSFGELENWVIENPDNFWGRRSLAAILMKREQFEDAKVHLLHLVELGAVTGEDGGVLELLSRVYQELGETAEERKTLEQMIGLSCRALPSLQRMITICQEQGEWENARKYIEKVLAINPLLPSAQLAMAEACEQLDLPVGAVRALGALSHMEPIDPAGLHYRMARSLVAIDRNDEAKEHVIAALEEAPRYRDAHRLLLTLTDNQSSNRAAEADVPEPEPVKEIP